MVKLFVAAESGINKIIARIGTCWTRRRHSARSAERVAGVQQLALRGATHGPSLRSERRSRSRAIPLSHGSRNWRRRLRKQPNAIATKPNTTQPYSPLIRIPPNQPASRIPRSASHAASASSRNSSRPLLRRVAGGPLPASICAPIVLRHAERPRDLGDGEVSGYCDGRRWHRAAGIAGHPVMAPDARKGRAPGGGTRP